MAWMLPALSLCVVCATIPTESLESMKEWVLRRHAYLFSSPAIHYKGGVTHPATT